MINSIVSDPMEDAIAEFEESWTSESLSSLDALLEQYELSNDEDALTELIRTDIEMRYSHGENVDLGEIFAKYGNAISDDVNAQKVAFEDFRSRRDHGLSLPLARWRHVPGVAGTIWFRELMASPNATEGMPSMSASMIRQNGRSLLRNVDGGEYLTDPFLRALRLSGFQLIQEIGTGELSRVYLATQHDLADRYVVLKVVTRPMAEPQAMAMLLHTNIVPIYSYHLIKGHSVICMPYAGKLTLKSFLDDHSEVASRSGQSLVRTVQASVDETHLKFDDGPIMGGLSIPLALPPAADDPAVQKPLERMSELGNEKLAPWLFGRVAAGLAHSHARGVLHNDLKPGNILIRNDGEPALLDFNLAQSLGDRPAANVGGTLPYMAPETLRAMLGQVEKPTEATDIYGLGVIMFEFVTGRLPYPTPESNAAEHLKAAIGLREQPIAWQSKDQVTPGMRGIIERCLRFEPGARYPSAKALEQDLQRESDDQSLLYASEPLTRRARKWFRRHPRAIYVGLAAALLTLLIPVAVAASIASSKANALAASAKSLEFIEQSDQTLAEMMADPKRNHEDAIDKALAPLTSFGVLDPDGLDSLISDDLPEQDQKRLREIVMRHAAQVALLEIDQLERLTKQTPPQKVDLTQLEQLTETVRRVSEGPESRVRLWLEAKVAELRGDKNFKDLTDLAEACPVTSDTEEYLEAVRLMTVQRYDDAREILMTLADRDTIPSALRWTVLGRSQFRARQYDDAKLSFTQSISRAKDSAGLYALRGLCYRGISQKRKAFADFSKALDLDPSNLEALINRAGLHQEAGRHEAAIADYTRLLEVLPDRANAILRRARSYRALGQTELADKEFERAFAIECTDFNSLTARSTALRLRKDFEGALRELRLAESLDPDNTTILSGVANLLSVELGRDAEAIAVYDKIIDIDESHEEARVNRAVLLARAGKFDDAKADLKVALQGGNASRTYFQAACVHALLPDEEETEQAMKYIALAHAAGYQKRELDEDPDLKSLYDREDFEALVHVYRLSYRPQVPFKAPR